MDLLLLAVDDRRGKTRGGARLAAALAAARLTELARAGKDERAHLAALAARGSAALPEPDRTVLSIARSAHRTLADRKEQGLNAYDAMGPIPPSAQWAAKYGGCAGAGLSPRGRTGKAETPAEAGVSWRRLRDLNPRWA